MWDGPLRGNRVGLVISGPWWVAILNPSRTWLRFKPLRTDLIRSIESHGAAFGLSFSLLPPGV